MSQSGGLVAGVTAQWPRPLTVGILDVLGLVYLGAAFAGARDRLWWAVLGVLSLIASVIMIASPGVAISTVALLVGIAFLIRGGGELALVRRMRGMHRGVTS